MTATPRIDPTAFVAPGCHLYGDIVIGARAVVMFGVVMRAEMDRITVGERTNLQDNVVVHVDEGAPCDIGGDVTVGHAAVLHGCRIEPSALVGIGAIILNHAVVGEGAWIGAGALVTEGSEIPPWTLAVGSPARAVRSLTDDEVRRQREGVAHYLRFAERYEDHLRR